MKDNLKHLIHLGSAVPCSLPLALAPWPLKVGGTVATGTGVSLVPQFPLLLVPFIGRRSGRPYCELTL